MVKKRRAKLARSDWKANRYVSSKTDNYKVVEKANSRRGEGAKNSEVNKVSIAIRWIIFIFVMANLVWWFGIVNELQIDYTSSRLNDQQKTEVQSISDSHMNGLHHFKYSSRSELKEQLEGLNYVGGVEFKVDFLSQKLNIIVSPQLIAAKLRDTNPQLYVDIHGVVVEGPAPPNDSREIPQLSDDTGLRATLGTNLTSAQAIDFISSFELAGANSNFSSSYYYSLTANPKQIDLVDPSLTYRIKLISTRSAADQLAEVQQLQQYLKKRGIIPSNYIDVRQDNTAYYK